MDLTGNPGTHTTKTFAVDAHRRAGGRAHPAYRRVDLHLHPHLGQQGDRPAGRGGPGVGGRAGQARPAVVVVLAPASTAHKFRPDRLADDPALRPSTRCCGSPARAAEGVKPLGRAFVDEYAAEAHDKYGLNLWYSLDLRNYLVADAARAAFEADASPTSAAGTALARARRLQRVRAARLQPRPGRAGGDRPGRAGRPPRLPAGAAPRHPGHGPQPPARQLLPVAPARLRTGPGGRRVDRSGRTRTSPRSPTTRTRSSTRPSTRTSRSRRRR